MSIKCLLNGMEVNYPCSPVCDLFGDCVTAFEAQKKENARTNADHIRAMSDEKLALFVHAIISAESCLFVDCDCDECFFKEPCSNSLKWYGKEIEWLQQSFEGE